MVRGGGPGDGTKDVRRRHTAVLGVPSLSGETTNGALSADNSVVRHEAMMTIRAHWAGPQRGAALILLAAIVATMPAPGVTAPALPARPGSAVADRCDGVDHLYRIIGKV